MFVVFDIDGTILDGSHKAHLIKHAEPGQPWPMQTDEDWQKWYAACKDDVPILPILRLANMLIRSANHKVEFWTGRYEACRKHTQDWLDRWSTFTACGSVPLRMRPLDEREDPDCVVKERFLGRYGRPDLIFEDRQSVVDMWRRNGIMCAQVAKGNY
jgi:hypothetical protein